MKPELHKTYRTRNGSTVTMRHYNECLKEMSYDEISSYQRVWCSDTGVCKSSDAYTSDHFFPQYDLVSEVHDIEVDGLDNDWLYDLRETAIHLVKLGDYKLACSILDTIMRHE